MTTITIGGRVGNTYSGMQDLHLLAAFPTNNYSNESSSQNEPFLLRPDLTGLPADCTITDAFWTFGVNSGVGGSIDLAPRLILRAWVEAEASWNNYSTGNAWTTAGCLSNGNDRAASASAVCTYPGGFDTADFVSTSNTQLIADIQAIADGTANNGWRFDGGVSVGLPGSATAALRPFLTVTYSVGAAVPVLLHQLRQQGIA